MESNQEIRERVDREISERRSPTDYSLLQQLALSCRVLAAEGHWINGLAGQITARGPVPDTYYTLKFGLGAHEATPESFIQTDGDLSPADGVSLPNPATRFHVWIYRALPQVKCIVHTHPPAATSLSMTGRPLAISTMDSTPFFENCAFLSEWPGLPITNDEGRIISEALGGKKSILLAHHGLLVAGASVAEATTLAVWMEQAAANQLRAEATGPIRKVPDHLARESRDFLLNPKITDMTFQYFARRALREDPTCLGTSSIPTIAEDLP